MNTIGRLATITMVTGALALTSRALAQDTTTPATTTPPAYPPPASTPPPTDTMSPGYDGSLWQKYHGQELSIDMFGTGRTEENYHNDFNHWHHEARGGGGVGLNYFFCRYVGIGADTFTEGSEPFLFSASGNVIGRIPIGNTGLAPYIMAGGGHQFDHGSDNYGQAGAGLEFRFCRHIGVFVDGRAVIPGQDRNYALFRAGLRLSF